MSTQTRRACVMGWPAKQSKGPIMHGYWLERYGIDGEYRIEEVPPERFPAFLANLANHGYVGGNVTLPHKIVALQNSEPDARARAIGAANTLWLDGGVLRSTNTDGEGFFRNLDLAIPGWNQDLGSVIVVGAGGASRAIVYDLCERGAEQINLVNRTPARAQALRDAFGPQVRPASFDDLDRLIPDARLIVNTSSLGMKGNPDLAWDLSRARPDTVVSDIVYSPLETSLLAEARRHGLRTTDGVGMLLHQAGRGFALWFGIEPEVTEEQRARVLAALAP